MSAVEHGPYKIRGSLLQPKRGGKRAGPRVTATAEPCLHSSSEELHV